ncbi:hypothetical protein PJI16_01425 [Nitrospira sp. MA-1]|nr:hypothetical protein [Nitrospira sp. MA-1]
MEWLSKLKNKLSRNKSPQFQPKGPPDNKFLGTFMVVQFIESPRFGLEEAQYKEFTAELPNELKDCTQAWILFYLSWIFKLLISSKYGEVFTRQFVAQAVELFQKAENLQPGLEGLSNTFSFWMSNLDDSTSHVGKKFEGLEIPLEVFAAWTFLFLDEGSPYYKKTDTNRIEFEVAKALILAKEAVVNRLQKAVDFGGPVEEANV